MRILKGLAVRLLIILAISVLVVWVATGRGFRATAVPPAWEATLARGIRNLAIPGHERRARNPLAATADALGQGREFFLNQCASCHGIDGSGKTPIGLNLYPRVPDLRAGATQNLTDGELHYIIKNGVQLTGMPAWGTAHEESSENSWKLGAFIRSLRPFSQEERAQQRASTARYVGSEACAKCHQQIYERWKKTPMANVV